MNKDEKKQKDNRLFTCSIDKKFIMDLFNPESKVWLQIIDEQNYIYLQTICLIKEIIG